MWDPDDTTSKVSRCVEPSKCFKNGNFYAVVKVPLALRKWAWPENRNKVNLKSASFIVIMLLHEGLAHIHSQKKA